MSNTVISVENVSKQYHLGTIGTGTFRNDLKLWWAKTRNKPNPLALVDEADHGNRDGEILWALKDVSFKVEQGEALGIIGRNGAGKSTLLKILSRVTTPTSGEVKVKGRIASLLEVGTGFHPELTGRENIFLNGAIMGMSRAEVARKFDEIVDFSGVERFIDTPVKRYSSGMYVRLAFAVAAHLEPEILIVDEVLAVGDADFQKKCLGKMGDVAHEGRTVLFVSHNMPAIATFCDQAILLEYGGISFQGETNLTISMYLKSKAELSGEKIWEDINNAPGNYFARIHRVCIKNQNNESTSNIQSGEDFSIEIEYFNTIDNSRLSVTLLVFTEEGAILLSSISNLEPDWHNKPRPTGMYVSNCFLPANLLTPSFYSIGVIICTKNYQDCIREDDLIKFQIIDDGDVRGDYYGGYTGIIRPLLQWTTKKISY